MQITGGIANSRKRIVRWRSATGQVGASVFAAGCPDAEVLKWLTRQFEAAPEAAPVPVEVAPPPVEDDEPPAPVEIEPAPASQNPFETPPAAPLPAAAGSRGGNLARMSLADLVAVAEAAGVTIPDKPKRPALIAAIKERREQCPV